MKSLPCRSPAGSARDGKPAILPSSRAAGRMDACSSHLLVPPSDARTLVPRALAHLERLLELALGRLTLPLALLARSDGDAQVAWRRRRRIECGCVRVTEGNRESSQSYVFVVREEQERQLAPRVHRNSAAAARIHRAGEHGSLCWRPGRASARVSCVATHFASPPAPTSPPHPPLVAAPPPCLRAHSPPLPRAGPRRRVACWFRLLRSRRRGPPRAS